MRWSGVRLYARKRPSEAGSGIRRNAFYRMTDSSVDGKDYLIHSSKREDYLAHYGILGQKWGIRRFQNPDGTLTEEGKKRYNDDTPESETWKKDEAKKLSDEELRRRNNRLQSERQYRDLTTSQAEKDRAQMKNEIKKDFLKKALLIPVGAVLAYAGTKLIKNNGTKIVDLLEKFGKQAVNKIKTKSILSKGFRNNIKKYAETRGNAAHKFQVEIDNMSRNGMKRPYSLNNRTYNYYPKAKGGLPRVWPWPDIVDKIAQKNG